MVLHGCAFAPGASAARCPDGCGTYRPVAVHSLSGLAVAKLFVAKQTIAKALAGGSPSLMKVLLHAADFLGKVRRRLRFGALSREPLLLLRFEWKGDSVECDWLMRPSDPWDKDLPEHMARENQTLQALRDAMSLREVIFESFPAVINAELRMFRADGEHRLELVMTGKVNRYNDVFQRVASVAMRAKLCGFNFTLNAGEMEGLTVVSLRS
jgi:hypothetical protein